MANRELSILVLGSLGPNQDRILALLALGHRVVYAYTEFHPDLIPILPSVTCAAVPRRNVIPMLEYLIAKYEIEIVYSLLNAHDDSTEVTLALLDANLGVPIVRHYKEHPCTPTVEERRMILETDGQIYINERSYEYFRKSYGAPMWSAHIIDADMIAQKYMGNNLMPKLSSDDGDPHILIAGGISMLNDRLDVREFCVEMGRRAIYTHIYGYPVGEDSAGRLTIPHEQTLRSYNRLASSQARVKLHNVIDATRFSEEWSRFDAGFMHAKVPPNHFSAAFEQMNLPHRYSAYLAAGLPLIVQQGGQEAMEDLIQENGIGIAYSSYDDLAEKLRDKALLGKVGASAVEKRVSFSFDASAAQLCDVLAKYART